MPTLEETIELLAELGLGAVVELKPAPGAETATGRAVAALVAGAGPRRCRRRWCRASGPRRWRRPRAVAPQLQRALLVGAVPRRWREQVAELDCEVLHVDQRRLDRTTLAELMAAGLAVFAYTVKLPDRAHELFSWGVEAVFSDCPERVGGRP